ncbi:hypothetical protein Dimus_038920 [Dionaea muscipula]
MKEAGTQSGQKRTKLYPVLQRSIQGHCSLSNSICILVLVAKNSIVPFPPNRRSHRTQHAPLRCSLLCFPLSSTHASFSARLPVPHTPGNMGIPVDNINHL